VSSKIHQSFWIILCVVGLANAAHARSETVRWSQAQAVLIAGFEIHWGEASGSYPNVIDVGIPTLGSDGTYSHTFQVPDDATVFLAARSRDTEGYYSAFSNQQRLDPPGSPPPPPSGDADWEEDFSSLQAGDDPPGWIDTASKNSLVENDALFEVAVLGGNKVMGTGSQALNIHSHLLGASDWTNYEFSGRMRVADPSGSVGVTAYSEFPNADVYYKLFRIGTDADASFRIVGHPALSCDTDNTGVDPSEDTWYRFRLEVASNSTENRIRARVWQDGTSEPPIWQASCTDSSSGRPTSGTVGLWSRGPSWKYWDDLAVTSVAPLDGGSGGGGTEELGTPGRPVLINP